MDDAQEVKALAEKLMTHPYPEGPTSIELHLRRLPAEWGAIPVPPGSQLLGSALHSRRGRPAEIEAIYVAEGDAQSVVSGYDAALKVGGWDASAGFDGMPGGFVPAGLAAAHQSYRHGNEGPILMVAALEGGLAETCGSVSIGTWPATCPRCACTGGPRAPNAFR